MSDPEDNPTATQESPEVPARLHMGIAEQGKLHALEGEHETALAYYRVAIDMTVHAEDPEIFFRHYLECVLESLEQIGAYAEVLNYCQKAVDLLERESNQGKSSPQELVHVYQRQGVVQLKAGDTAAARQALATAFALAKECGMELPLARTLINWMDRGYRIDPLRILAEQRRSRYFNVRRDTVDSDRAIRVPKEHLFRGFGAA